MKATAWTVFKGGVAEPIPVEILGIMENSWGPGEDIIMAKVGGKAERTNVAGGMSGQPGLLRRKAARRDFVCGSAFSLPIRHRRHHPDRADAGDQRTRQEPADAGRARPPEGFGSADSRSGQRDLPFAGQGLEPDLAAEIWNAASEPAESKLLHDADRNAVGVLGRASRRSRCV